MSSHSGDLILAIAVVAGLLGAAARAAARFVSSLRQSSSLAQAWHYAIKGEFQ
jgi:hypothetical protein